MKKDGYTWEDLDKAWWEGFDNAKNKMEKQIAELEQKVETERSCRIELVNKIANLEAQIEKMKCCGNCKYYNFQNDAGYYTCTKDGKRNGKNYRSCEFDLEKWERR